MAKPRNDLSVEDVRAFFDYDKERGELIWRAIDRFRRGGNSRVGKVAGCVQGGGYKYVRLNGRSYLVHRLIHLHQTGEWPKAGIDHFADKADNTKIREADQAQNGWNRGKPKNNTSGYKGVSWHAQNKRWRAQIVARSKHYSLGLYPTKEEAYDAYCKAARKLHGDFANTG